MRTLASTFADDSAQNALEYLVVAGILALVLGAAFVLGLPYILSQFIGVLCPSVDPVGSASAVGRCIGGPGG